MYKKNLARTKTLEGEQLWQFVSYGCPVDTNRCILGKPPGLWASLTVPHGSFNASSAYGQFAQDVRLPVAGRTGAIGLVSPASSSHSTTGPATLQSYEWGAVPTNPGTLYSGLKLGRLNEFDCTLPYAAPLPPTAR